MYHKVQNPRMYFRGSYDYQNIQRLIPEAVQPSVLYKGDATVLYTIVLYNKDTTEQYNKDTT
jgi:hypothetical protein